uniref:Uncharacterized protein n=1 Tax=Tanacetum cinerariifolium TaxID=118510 RepID=A0A6L2JRG0_TANCI|nr:hypothetical protein [Tanacetum cinerariifolium]
MAALKYNDDHNKIAYLGREKGCEDFPDILNYLDQSPLRYALTHDPPVVFDSLVKQFWATVVVRLNEAGPHDLVATVDDHEIGSRSSSLDPPPPMMDIAAGNAPAGAAVGDDAADEANVVANYAAGGAAEAPQAPQSPLVSPVREPISKRQPTPERPLSPPPSNPETEWVVSDPVSPVAGWRSWPYVHVHFSEPESPPFPPEQTVLYEEPIEFDPVPKQPGPDNYVKPKEPDVIISMKDDTIHGGFHVESPVYGTYCYIGERLGTSKQVMGGAILKLVKRVKRLAKQAHLRRRKLVIADSDEEAEDAAAKEDDIDLDEIIALATAALGPEQPVVPTKNVEPMEEQKEMEVPLTRKWSTYRRARTQFHTTAYARFRSTTSTGVPSQTVVPEPAASYVAPDTTGSDPTLARELLGADVNEENFIPRMNAMKERKKRALADLRYRALQNKPLKKSEQLIEEYEYICKILENARLLTAQHGLFRPKPTITEPSAKRQRVEEPSSQPATVSATLVSATAVSAALRFTDSTVITTAAMDSVVTRSQEFFLDSDEEMPPGVSHVAAEPDFDDEVVAEILFRGKSICGDRVVFVDTLPDDEIADPRVKLETVSESTSSPPLTRRKHLGERGEAFLCDRPVEAFFSSDNDSGDDDSEYSLPYSEFQDWEVVRCPPGNSYIHVYHREDRRRKYFTYLKELLPHVYLHDIHALRRKMNRHFRLNPDADDGLDLWRDVNMLCRSLHADDVEEFWRDQDDWISVYMFMGSSYPIRATLLERMLRHRLTVPPSYCRHVRVGGIVAGTMAGTIIRTVQADLLQATMPVSSAPMDVNMLCWSLHVDDVEEFWRDQDDWIVSSWTLYTKSTVHVLDLTNGKTVYMFMGSSYPIQATLLERMLGHMLTVPPSYCQHVRVGGIVVGTMAGLFMNEKWLVQEGTALGKDLLKSVDSCQVTQNWMFVLAVSFVSAGYVVSAAIYVSVLSSSILLLREDLSRNMELTESTPSLGEDCWELLKRLRVFLLEDLEAVPAGYDIVPAGHVLVSADRYRIC